MKKIAFFIGSDVTSHFVLQDTLKLLKKSGIKSEVFLPSHMASKRKLSEDLILMAKYERSILNEVVYPFLETNNIISENLYSAPRGLKNIYDVTVTEVKDINDNQFQKYVFNNFDGVISIRCYHKFDKNYISHFNSPNKFIWNLHPGNLPKYRGVMTCIRAMSNNEQTHSYSLHVMDENWDAGSVIAREQIPLFPKVSMLENMCNLYPTGALILEKCINNFYRGSNIPMIEQNNHVYYTFPTEQDIQSYKERNLRLYDHEFMMDFYINNFLPVNSNHCDSLRTSICSYLGYAV